MVQLRPHLRRLLCRLRRAALVVIAVFLLACAAWQAALRLIPYPANWGKYPRGATVLLDRQGNELAAFVGQQDAWYVPLESAAISPHLKKAIVAVEDRRFFEHRGFDWHAAFAAAWQDITAFHIIRGASTLDMQVQRLREPRPRSWAAKLEQAFRGAQLDRLLTKDQVLTEYINRAPFGGNLVGAGAASWKYFGKSCRDLSLGQAALLAGLPQSPNRFRPDRYPEKARQRREHVLRQMLDTAAITPAEFAAANAEPIDAIWRPLPQEAAHAAFGSLPALASLAACRPGQRVATTIDRAIQAAAWQAASDRLATLSSEGIDSAAVVVIDVRTAELRAAVSLSSASPALDLTRTPRSTGSILKPFIYAAAFDMGILQPRTMLLDSPAAWAGYVPANFDKTFRGRLSASDALAESRNIPAMVVLSKVGVDQALGVMQEFGVQTPSASGGAKKYGLSLAIGGAEASVFKVAEAYATLARGGTHRPIRLVSGSASPEPVRILPEQICWQTLACINARARTEEVEGALPAANLAAAWKTGTSNGLRDAWCAAATPRFVVVAWLGNSAGKGSSALVGQEAAAPLALQLLGRLDPGGESWPVDGGRGAESNELAQSPAALADVLIASTRLAIVSPKPATEILIEDGQSPRVALKSAGGEGTKRWWFANSELIGAAEAGQTLWWPARPGAYELRVIDESTHAATLKVRVR